VAGDSSRLGHAHQQLVGEVAGVLQVAAHRTRRRGRDQRREPVRHAERLRVA
jgi:hypothetical protein